MNYQIISNGFVLPLHGSLFLRPSLSLVSDIAAEFQGY